VGGCVSTLLLVEEESSLLATSASWVAIDVGMQVKHSVFQLMRGGEASKSGDDMVIKMGVPSRGH
jgi:hypothetical protein